MVKLIFGVGLKVLSCSSLAVLGMVKPNSVTADVSYGCSSLAVLGMVKLLASLIHPVHRCSSLAVLGMVKLCPC